MTILSLSNKLWFFNLIILFYVVGFSIIYFLGGNWGLLFYLNWLSYGNFFIPFAYFPLLIFIFQVYLKVSQKRLVNYSLARLFMNFILMELVFFIIFFVIFLPLYYKWGGAICWNDRFFICVNDKVRMWDQ